MATFYRIACVFKFSELVKLSSSYIQRCFPMVCKTNNFMNLNFAQIAKIISSSELNIDSEMEVINAIDNWISYDFEKRSKFSSRLLSKVHLNLLSAKALNSILDSELSVSKIDDCVAILTKDFTKNKSSFKNKLSRYCSQNMYNIILSGGFIKKVNVFKVSDVTNKIDIKNFNNVKYMNPIRIKRRNHKSVYCNGEVYVFGGFDVNKQFIKTVDKYSLATNNWEIVGEMFDYRKGFNVCRFIDKVYIFGGCGKSWNPLYSCDIFDTNNNKWYEVAKTNEARINAASTVYEEKIIVSGGWNNNIDLNLKTVVAYDPLSNTWSSMRNMIKDRCGHSSIAVKNKLFVLGSYDGKGSESCEVFDSNCKNFVMIKRFPSTLTFDLGFAKTFAIGNKLITLGNISSTALYYEVEKGKWSEETFNLTKDNIFFSFILIPQMKF